MAEAAAKVPTITLKQVAASLAEKQGLSKKDSVAFVEAFIVQLTKHLKKGEKIRLTGLGIFAVRKRPARTGRNPATGEPIKIKASKKIAFRPAKELKEAV